MKKYISLFMVVLSVATFLVACSPTDDMKKEKMDDGMHDSMDEKMNEGSMAPELVLEDLMGNTVDLKDYMGKKVFIKYWASWCPICTGGLDDIDELSKQDDFMVLTIVTPGYKGEMGAMEFKDWFKSLDFDHTTVLLDIDGDVSKEFGIIGFPTSIFIGSDGVVTKVLPGHKSNSDIIESMGMIK